MVSAVTIVCCYRTGTLRMMEACARAVVRHTKMDYEFLIVTRDAEPGELDGVLGAFCPSTAMVLRVDVLDGPGVHGRMLDEALASGVARHGAPFVLTLDSDCLPVADGWLAGLHAGVVRAGVGAAGILHPWAPPPADMGRDTIEWRVRSQHCWESTHVACQLVPREFATHFGVGFADGDDTGLEVVKLIKTMGLRCEGFMPSRCPLSMTDFDPELNRQVGVVYGDMVYHHGGHTRVSACGGDAALRRSFGWALDRVLEEGGAEWLLDDAVSHRYALDREEEVAAEKMKRLFGFDSWRVEG